MPRPEPAPNKELRKARRDRAGARDEEKQFSQ
jgi:hypothetical protein